MEGTCLPLSVLPCPNHECTINHHFVGAFPILSTHNPWLILTWYTEASQQLDTLLYTDPRKRNVAIAADCFFPFEPREFHNPAVNHKHKKGYLRECVNASVCTLNSFPVESVFQPFSDGTDLFSHTAVVGILVPFVSEMEVLAAGKRDLDARRDRVVRGNIACKLGKVLQKSAIHDPVI